MRRLILQNLSHTGGFLLSFFAVCPAIIRQEELLRFVNGLSGQNVKIPEQAWCCATMATPRLTTWYARRFLKKSSKRKMTCVPVRNSPREPSTT